MTSKGIFELPLNLQKTIGGRGTIGLLIVVLVLATALRLYRLGEGLWLDEILTYVKFARLPIGEIVTQFDSENQHFLYSIFSHISFQLFGESAWALRLPAVFFGIGSIAALYLFGRQVTTELESFLATLLMTFSYHHIWFSQNARGYTGLLFWTLISSWLLLISLKQSKRWLWILFGLTAALGVYTHLTMLFVIVGQFFVFLVVRWKSGRVDLRGIFSELIYGFGWAGLLVLIMHAPVLNQMRSVIGVSEVSVVAEWKSPLWTILEFVRGLEVGFSGIVVTVVALCWFAIGLYSYLRHKIEVFLLLTVPAVFGAGVTLAIGHHLWPRFFFFTFGFLALIVIRGGMILAAWIGRLLHWSPKLSTKIGTIICCGIIGISALSIPFAYGPKQDYQGAYNYIQANRQRGDAVIIVSVADFVYENLYQTDWEPVTSLDQLYTIQNQAQRTWFVYSFPPVASSVFPDIMQHIHQNYSAIKEFPGTVSAGTIYVYRYDSVH